MTHLQKIRLISLAHFGSNNISYLLLISFALNCFTMLLPNTCALECDLLTMEPLQILSSKMKSIATVQTIDGPTGRWCLGHREKTPLDIRAETEEAVPGAPGGHIYHHRLQRSRKGFSTQLLQRTWPYDTCSDSGPLKCERISVVLSLFSNLLQQP